VETDGPEGNCKEIADDGKNIQLALADLETDDIEESVPMMDEPKVDNRTLEDIMEKQSQTEWERRELLKERFAFELSKWNKKGLLLKLINDVSSVINKVFADQEKERKELASLKEKMRNKTRNVVEHLHIKKQKVLQWEKEKKEDIEQQAEKTSAQMKEEKERMKKWAKNQLDIVKKYKKYQEKKLETTEKEREEKLALDMKKQFERKEEALKKKMQGQEKEIRASLLTQNREKVRKLKKLYISTSEQLKEQKEQIKKAESELRALKKSQEEVSKQEPNKITRKSFRPQPEGPKAVSLVPESLLMSVSQPPPPPPTPTYCTFCAQKN